MADKYKEVKSRIETFIARYWKSSLPEPELSELYDLFPKKSTEQSQVIASKKWPETYPHADRRGVYVILDCKLNVLYIGKASMNNCIGNRLSSYFGYEDDGETCRVWHSNWSASPRYVFVIAFDNKLAFGAPALEEYLLGTVETVDNTIRIEKGIFK